MTLTKKINHVSEALANFIEQFKNKPNFVAVTTAIVNQIQDLEEAFFELLTDRYLDVAFGVQLDGLGLIVDEDREGRGDDEYRIAIRARILLNLGDGTPEDLIELLKAVSDGGTVQLTEYYPAALTMFVLLALDLTTALRLNRALQSGKSAGVDAHLIYGESDPGELFRFDYGRDWGTPPNIGFDQGKWAGIITGEFVLFYIKSRTTGEFLISRDSDKLLIVR